MCVLDHSSVELPSESQFHLVSRISSSVKSCSNTFELKVAAASQRKAKCLLEKGVLVKMTRQRLRFLYTMARRIRKGVKKRLSPKNTKPAVKHSGGTTMLRANLPANGAGKYNRVYNVRKKDNNFQVLQFDLRPWRWKLELIDASFNRVITQTHMRSGFRMGRKTKFKEWSS